MKKLMVLAALLAMLAGMLAVGRAPVARAATFNIADGDVGGLIAAIDTANGNGVADTINLAPGGTYTLTAVDNTACFGVNGLPVITTEITINGNGATIERSGAAPDFRIFCVTGAHLMLNDLTIQNGSATFGGGIYNYDTLTLTGSTVSGNTASNGGGILNNGTLTLTNSTVSGNSAGGGGGIWNNSGTVTLTNSTVSGNTAGGGGGIFNNATLTLKNTIVANSPSGGDCAVSTPIASLGYNLDSDGTCNLGAAGDLPSTNPLLAPLADNGGPTQTHALLPGSPAIDAGSIDCPPPITDQRGVIRPQGSACDIGAYELEQLTVTVDIDIKPGSDPNSINPRSRGIIPVAILTTEDFDATTVDASTVAFGPDEAEPVHNGHIEDVDNDGDDDLVLHFRTQDTGIAEGDSEACLTGETTGGVAIEGCDAIRTVGR